MKYDYFKNVDFRKQETDFEGNRKNSKEWKETQSHWKKLKEEFTLPIDKSYNKTWKM
jgi:hypothetical protein